MIVMMIAITPSLNASSLPLPMVAPLRPQVGAQHRAAPAGVGGFCIGVPRADNGLMARSEIGEPPFSCRANRISWDCYAASPR